MDKLAEDPKMKAVSIAHKVATFAEVWRKTYYRDAIGWYHESQEAIYEKLKLLNPPTQQGIQAIIDEHPSGKFGWFMITCYICDREVQSAVEMETDMCSDMGNSSITICADCLALANEALAKLKE